ncbi:MAG: flagellar hook-basal body protein [Rhizobium sp.]|nr:flagellar hook-basal body protein [Rhizobium sp.]
MSLYGMMRTGSSGMNAQASRLSTVADNIANSSTTGYKTASTEFSSLLLSATGGSYNSGAVESDIRYAISNQGALTYTSSDTDLAINGNGFFVVQGADGQPFMTRAGSFVPNADGELVNAAGYKLLGYPYTTEPPTPVVNGFNGLVPVTVGSNSLIATPSTLGSFSANLDELSDIVDTSAGALTPGTAAAGDTPVFTHKSSVKAYDSLGGEVLVDLYFTKTADNTWEVAMYNSADADPTSGGFPYSSDPLALDADMTTTPPTVGTETAMTLTFDGAGQILSSDIGGTTITNDPDLTANPDFANLGKVNLADVSGIAGLTLDLSEMSNYKYDFTIQGATVNGNAPSQVDKVQIDNDGTVFAQYQNGDLIPVYRVAMANVQSPDELSVISGNIYAQSADSGVVILGFPGSSGLGSITSGALESSNVDLAEELTKMIESQRTYTANSKVFQTGADLLDVLVNLKR